MADLTPGIVLATTNFDKTVQTLVQKKLEELLRAPLPHLLPGNFIPASFVKGSNSTMRFINVPDLAVSTNDNTITKGTSPWLYEGTPPTDEALTIGYEEFTAYQAGRTIAMSDLAIEESPHDIVGLAVDRLARSAVATMDLYVANVLLAGTNVMYVGTSRAGTNTSNILTGDVVKQAVAYMKEDNIPTFGDGTYRAIARPSAIYQLMSDTAVGGWVDAQRYAGATALFTGEIGRYAGVRFIESSNAKSVASSGTVGFGTANMSAATIANGTGVVTLASHGLRVGQPMYAVSVTTSDLAVSTKYWVIATPTVDTYTISLTHGGAAVTATAGTALVMKKLADIDSTFLFGPGAYTFGDWGTVEAFYSAPGGLTDPLHQLSKVGWKARFGAMIVGQGTSATNVSPARYLRIESANSLVS